MKNNYDSYLSTSERQNLRRQEIERKLTRATQNNAKLAERITRPQKRLPDGAPLSTRYDQSAYRSLADNTHKSERHGFKWRRILVGLTLTAIIAGAGTYGYINHQQILEHFVRPQVVLATPLPETSSQIITPTPVFESGQQVIPPPINMVNVDSSVIPNTNVETQIQINPQLLRIVDQQHPIAEQEVKTKIEPNLVKIVDYIKNINLINNKARINQICVEDLSQLADSAQSDGIKLTIHDSYRDFYAQRQAYNQAPTKTVVTQPGYSQHHTGLAIDFTTPEIRNIIDVNSGFADTSAGRWLNQNAWKYGFVQSYTNGHDGIKNEPWHYLYVGREIAKDWYDSRQINPDIDIFQILQKYPSNQ